MLGDGRPRLLELGTRCHMGGAATVLAAVSAYRRAGAYPPRGRGLSGFIALATPLSGLAIRVFKAIQVGLREFAHFFEMKCSSCTTNIEPLEKLVRRLSNL